MLIYHYTTISGLIGIISNKELWASDCRFLNDGAELSYARDIFMEEVKKLNLPPIEGGGYRLPGDSLDYFQMYIACFCEDGDLLSQWRGYGTNQGYSLGFDIDELRTTDIRIKPVQYGIVDPKVYFKDELDNASQPTAHPGVEEWHQSLWILPRLAIVKHPSFNEEREWRLMKQNPSYEGNDHEFEINFRPSRLGPVGYIRIPFPVECLHEVVIGPGEYPTARELAVNNFLTNNGFHDVAVKNSKIPFRV